MRGRERGRWGEGGSDHGRVLGSAWRGRFWGKVAVRGEIEGTKVRTETRDRIEVRERHRWVVVGKDELKGQSYIYITVKILPVKSVPTAIQIQSKW